jgi:chaperone modulatory protein CbpM
MIQHDDGTFEGQVIDERSEISIIQLCRICSVESAMVERMVEEGIIEPVRYEGDTLYFSQSCLKRTRIVMNLRSDLGVNLAGAALVLELLERIEKLQARLSRV